MASSKVFVPLKKEHFESFSNGKTFELRKAERNFAEKHLYEGKTVVIGCGYSGPRKAGIVGRIVCGSLDKIFRQVSYKLIEPSAKNKEEAKKINKKLLGKADKYIAFEIILDAGYFDKLL